MSTMDDLKNLGDYATFTFERDVFGEVTKVYAVTIVDDKTHRWLVKPVDGRYYSDVKANTFYVFGLQGLFALLYRAKDVAKGFRIVFLPRPIQKVPQTDRRYGGRRRKKP